MYILLDASVVDGVLDARILGMYASPVEVLDAVTEFIDPTMDAVKLCQRASALSGEETLVYVAATDDEDNCVVQIHYW